MPFRQQRAPGIKGLVASAGVRIGDDRVDDDVVAVFVGARRVASQDDRQPVGGVPDAAQGPQVVHVKRTGADADDDPARPCGGARDVLQLQPAERVHGVLGGGDGGKHTSEADRSPAMLQPVVPKDGTADGAGAGHAVS